MVGLLILGAWLASGPGAAPEGREGSVVLELRIGSTKAWVDVLGSGDAQTFRVMSQDGQPGRVMDEASFVEVFGEGVLASVRERRDNALFRYLNITSWAGVLWVAVGFGGQAAFFGRMLVQWVISERERASVVPPVFWWLSLLGGVCLFSYFVWRQDIVGVLGQSSGVVIYARNVRLIYKQRRRDRREAAERAAEGESARPGPDVADDANSGIASS